MRVLVACEVSGTVRDAFIRRGHDAWSCDLMDSLKEGPHIKGDVLEVLSNARKYGYWDLMVAHPPCAYLCNSSVRWLYKADGSRNEPRWENMEDAALLFFGLYASRVPRICVENPIMHRHARELIGAGPTQYIKPCQFGHGETKTTGLWLVDLPPLMPTDIVEGGEGRIHKMALSPDRGVLRSITYAGIAEAMAAQWGILG